MDAYLNLYEFLYAEFVVIRSATALNEKVDSDIKKFGISIFSLLMGKGFSESSARFRFLLRKHRPLHDEIGFSLLIQSTSAIYF
jgi:hypothetical protein